VNFEIERLCVSIVRSRLFDDVMLDESINSDWFTRAFAQAVRMSKSPSSKLKVVGGLLIAFLILVALFVLRESKGVVTTERTPSPPGIFAPSDTSLKPTAAEMVPIYTGGAGGNSSLGGTAAVGRGTHH
jgi:hypothetical protein